MWQVLSLTSLLLLGYFSIKERELSDYLVILEG
jgi:hypothetical protein